MKWKDLSLKERKQIYDSVRVNNPDATYFDIKEQFDSIPTYEDGKGKTINKADLPPEYRTGTPEYFERQRKISGAVNTVQPEAYITPAGYIKDAVNFIEDLGKGDYLCSLEKNKKTNNQYERVRRSIPTISCTKL